MCKIGKNRKAHVDFEFRPHFFQSTTKQYQEPPHKISFSLAKVLNLTNFGTNLSSRGAPTNLAKCKLHPIQNFRAPSDVTPIRLIALGQRLGPFLFNFFIFFYFD